MNPRQNPREEEGAAGNQRAHSQISAIRNGIFFAGSLALAFLYLLATSPAVREERAKNLHPHPNFAPLLLLLLLIPFLTALVLIGRSTRRDLADFGAGVSIGLFGVALLCSPSIMMVLSVAALAEDAHLLLAVIVLIAFFADAAWVVRCSLRVPKKSSEQFVTAACLTVAYLVVGFGGIISYGVLGAQQKEKQRGEQTISSWKKGDAARSAVALSTACLIQYRESEPGREFPVSLANLPADLKLPSGKPCDAGVAKPGMLSDYTITYTPEPDAATDKITDFRLLAMPDKKGLDYVNPMLSDSRGRIWVYESWWATEQGEHLTPQLAEQPDDWTASHILSLSSTIRYEMKEKAMERPPSSLSELPGITSPQEATSSPDILNESPYTIQYFPPRPGSSEGFALSAVCQKYGDKCIRSFFLDTGGDIHQSAAPRPATTDDPLIPDCEKYVQGCRDIDWPVP